VNKFEIKRFRLKIGFAVAAILIPIVLLYLGIRAGGKISLRGIQVAYAVLSSEIALAVYMWGVGNWSRFEPPQSSSGFPTTSASDPSQQPLKDPTPAVQINVAPPAAQGGH
jgi:hypothetical protein